MKALPTFIECASSHIEGNVWLSANNAAPLDEFISTKLIAFVPNPRKILAIQT